MSSAIKILPYYTYKDYCLWEGRWEILDGIPFAMSPAPVPRHQWISSNFKSEMRQAIKKANCPHCKVYDFIDIKVSEDTVVQPDAIVVCKEITQPFLDFAAALVVEVLSPSTAMKDRNNKFYIYQAQNIPYYIIIDIDKNEIELYHLKEDGKYRLETVSFEDPYIFFLSDGCAVPLVLNNIWT